MEGSLKKNKIAKKTDPLRPWSRGNTDVRGDVASLQDLAQTDINPSQQKTILISHLAA